MLAKIVDISKKTFLYILAPLALIAGYVFHLLTKVEKLKGDLNRAKSSQEMADALEKKEEADHEASDAVANYELIKSQYLRDRDKKDDV